MNYFYVACTFQNSYTHTSESKNITPTILAFYITNGHNNTLSMQKPLKENKHYLMLTHLHLMFELLPKAVQTILLLEKRLSK